MSTDEDVKRQEMFAEFERLGLNIRDLPGLAHSGGLDPFLARLRAMKPGVTWHEVLPDLPKEFIPGRFETWPRRYKPIGAYDYPTLPAGPAIHICFEGRHDPERFDAFVTKAKEAGWRVYGAGLIPVSNPKWTTLDGYIILEYQTTEDELGEFWSWIDEQDDLEVCALSRNVPAREDYNC